MNRSELPAGSLSRSIDWTRWVLPLVFCVALPLSSLMGCRRSRQAAAPAGESSWSGLPLSQAGTTTVAPDPTAHRSEFVAQGKPDRKCRDCRQPDASGGPVYHGRPLMKLDEATLDDVRETVVQTCELLEQGVIILEKHVKRPEKATAALRLFEKKHAQKIKRVFHRADEVRARLAGAGYDQDIPGEIQPMFEERMGAIQKRLEKMRDVYREHSDVLEAFGALFPRVR